MGAEPRIAILGAGMSGLCMAIQLAKAGIRSFTLFERGDRIGGTWRDNTYPGCACDVPSHLYSFSFDRERGWSRMFAEQPEILRYFERVAEERGVLPHVRLGTEIVEARFDEARAVWRLSARDGTEHEAEVVVSAVGQLNRPHYPDIPGLDTFGGTAFHSARWDHDHDLTGERVGVIGNAASAVQFVPRIAPLAERLTIFQRSANWIIPKPDRLYSALERRLLDLPRLEALYRSSIYWLLEARFLMFARRTWLSERVERMAREHLEAQIADPDLRAKLTPDYPVGCKRILISNNYYPTLVRSDVELCTEPIERATREGLITRDGVTRPFDTLIFATGFESTRFLAPMEVRGLGGRSLKDAWKGGAEAYLGVAVSGFPNFFVLYGPNTNLGHNSIIFMVEQQVRYAVRCIEELVGRELAWLDVRPEVMERYNRDVQAKAQRTVWAAECGSWYKTESGKITNNWPDFTFRYARRLRRPDLGDFHQQPKDAVTTAALRDGAAIA